MGEGPPSCAFNAGEWPDGQSHIQDCAPGLRFASAADGVRLLSEGEFDEWLELDRSAAAVHAASTARVALRVVVRDVAAAGVCLQSAGVDWAQTAQGLRIAPEDAAGAWLLLSAA